MSISNLINGTQALPSLVNLNGEVQDAINRLVMLKLNRLILDGFDLEVLPSELAELMRRGILPSIEQLFLQRNKLRTLSPEINLHKRLTQLHLQSNELTDLPEELRELTLLEELDISNNKFAHVPLPICHMVSIKKLHLQNNLIRKIPLEIGELQNLEQLNLSYNQLTELPLEFGRLTKLTTLKLDTNKLTMFPREFGLLINLHFLSAVQNNIVHLPPEFGELAKLETLLLHENPQLSILPTSIIRLSNLRKMTLDLPVLIAPQFISAGPKVMHHFVLFCQRLRLHINSRQHWVPDEASKHCSRCNTIFTMVTRRHHCRLCGKLYDNKCCHRTKKYPSLEPFLPARVCEICYAGLKDISVPDPVSAKAKVLNYSGQSLLSSSNISTLENGISHSTTSTTSEVSGTSHHEPEVITGVPPSLPDKSPVKRSGLHAIHSVGSVRGDVQIDRTYIAPPLPSAPPMPHKAEAPLAPPVPTIPSGPAIPRPSLPPPISAANVPRPATVNPPNTSGGSKIVMNRAGTLPSALPTPVYKPPPPIGKRGESKSSELTVAAIPAAASTAPVTEVTTTAIENGHDHEPVTLQRQKSHSQAQRQSQKVLPLPAPPSSHHVPHKHTEELPPPPPPVDYESQTTT